MLVDPNAGQDTNAEAGEEGEEKGEEEEKEEGEEKDGEEEKEEGDAGQDDEDLKRDEEDQEPNSADSSSKPRVAINIANVNDESLDASFERESDHCSPIKPLIESENLTVIKEIQDD